eukprot:15474635-Alexandrium_andersonii.AAC.1
MVAPPSRPAVVLAPPGPPAHPGAVAFAQLAGLAGSGAGHAGNAFGLGQLGQLAVAPPVQHAQIPMMLEACWRAQSLIPICMIVSFGHGQAPSTSETYQ